jgi:DNA-directed RNA polymerase sigma subunit (sigma70/sigma32)
MVEAYLARVRTIARDFLGREPEKDDLVVEGNPGLIRTAKGLDPRTRLRHTLAPEARS